MKAGKECRVRVRSKDAQHAAPTLRDIGRVCPQTFALLESAQEVRIEQEPVAQSSYRCGCIGNHSVCRCCARRREGGGQRQRQEQHEPQHWQRDHLAVLVRRQRLLLLDPPHVGRPAIGVQPTYSTGAGPGRLGAQHPRRGPVPVAFADRSVIGPRNLPVDRGAGARGGI